MGVSWKTGVGRSTVLLVVAFICGVIFIHKAKQFAGAAPSERTATVPDKYMHCQKTYDIIGVVLRGSKYSCSYSFNVDGTSYDGQAFCAQPSAAATFYYDSADPSLNSLLEFGAASEQEYREAALWIGVLTPFIFFVVFSALLDATKNRGDGRAAVDARGTVIYPDEIGFGSGPGGLPGGSRRTGAFNAAHSDEAAKATDPSPSPALRELYLEVVNRIHPDRASNEPDRALRERLMKEANAAFGSGEAETLRKVLVEYKGAIPAS